MRGQAETSPRSGEEAPTENTLRQEVLDLQQRAERLRIEFESLQTTYESQIDSFVSASASDVSAISDLKSKAEKLVDLIQGGSLFGRYAHDAESQAIAANRWRRFAVLVLLAAVALELFLVTGPISLEGLRLLAPLAPLLLLFTYASIESHNHRRGELNRRRIYLRMAAIESYIERDAEGITSAELEGILREFIEQHFIAPDLDPNDVRSVDSKGIWSLPFWGRSK
jgi:hypothetical protein